LGADIEISKSTFKNFNTCGSIIRNFKLEVNPITTEILQVGDDELDSILEDYYERHN